MSITIRGDIITITVPISFSKKDVRGSRWDKVKQELIDKVDESYLKQIKEVEGRVGHEDEVRERIKDQRLR